MQMINIGSSDNIFDYFDNLLNNIDDSASMRIKIELMKLLETKINQFSGGNSSVSKERGQALMNANIYLIGLYLKQFETSKSIEYLKNYSISEIYQQGSSLIKEMLHHAKLAVDNFIVELLRIDLQVYYDTLFRGLPLFFKSYNFDYNPQDAVLTFDYPTYQHLTNKQGIELFLEYFKFIQLENGFNQLFSKDLINEMLFYYQRDYRNLVFNVTNLLLKQLLLKQMIKGNFSYLYLTMVELIEIVKCIDCSKNIKVLIFEAFNELAVELQLDASLYNYLQRGLEEIIIELESNYQLKKLVSELAVAL